MINNELSEAFAEMNVILEYLPIQYVNKIPNKLKNFFSTTASKTYQVKMNPSMSLEEQDIKEKTKDLITILYRNYWCNAEERKEIDAKLVENQMKYQEQQRKKYDPDNIFKNNKKEIIQEEQQVSENMSIVVYKESVFQKIIKKIKNILHF